MTRPAGPRGADEARELGRTGVRVPPLGLGCAPIGNFRLGPWARRRPARSWRRPWRRAGATWTPPRTTASACPRSAWAAPWPDATAPRT
ncbi:hypothetical protein LUW77_06005 [Streptomyces radiopugnans]|nr:hypothetical protein LUW77_06005 [Streptomyces radiopugnans]